MPLWRIFASPSTFSPAQREGIAKTITTLYRSLPAFYVDVIFIDIAENGMWVGGVESKNFVRIAVEQIARQMPDANTEEGQLMRTRWMDIITKVCRSVLRSE